MLYQPKTTAEASLNVLSNLQLMFALSETLQASLKAGDTSIDASVLTFRAAALTKLLLTESEKAAKIVPDALELRRRVECLYVKDHPEKIKLAIDDSSELALARQTMWTCCPHLRVALEHEVKCRAPTSLLQSSLALGDVLLKILIFPV